MPGFVVLVLLGAGFPLCEMPLSDVDVYLSGLQGRHPLFSERVCEVAGQSLGTPYAGDPLGEGPEGGYDKDPLMDLGRVDCVTFVEQTIALAASDSYQAALGLLQKIRYKNGEIAFEKRNHFMIADWIANNSFCRDVSGQLGVPTESVTRTMGRKHFYEAKKLPELGRDAVEETVTLAYVPASAVAEAERRLPSPALVLFIGKVDWLFTLHCGLYIRSADGQGLLYNASSKAGKVIADSLSSCFASGRYLGFTAYEIGDPTKKGTGFKGFCSSKAKG